MSTPLIILTGASGAGKTTIGRVLAQKYPGVLVLEADTLESPSPKFVESIGLTEGPGGAFQRSRALFLIGSIAGILMAGRPIVLDIQCRIAFLEEALSVHRITTAKIVLVECTEQQREARLHGRGSSDLANEQMQNWSQYLHEEAYKSRLSILNTCEHSIEESVQLLVGFLLPLLIE